MIEKGPRIVFGRIVGEHLPTKHVVIGNVHLGPMPYVGVPMERLAGADIRAPEAVRPSFLTQICS
jgi:hypothetical protein